MASRDESDTDRYFSGDLLVEILQRLPVKSLLKFKCVCKNWYSLITNPSFARKHHEYQRTKNYGRLFIQHFDSRSSRCGYSLFPDETLAVGTYYNLDHLQPLTNLVNIEGSINGLFCLYDGWDQVILWNPAMREFATLPIPKPGFRGNVGFGLDPATNDYKIILIPDTISTTTASDDDCAMVYAALIGDWRRLNLECAPRNLFSPCHECRMYFNGFYYWLLTNFALLSFDMGKEVFRLIEGPDIPNTSPIDHVVDLGMYNGHIALLHWNLYYGIHSQFIVVWAMEEEGRWIKQSCIELNLRPRLRPLGFWKTRELLFFTNNGSDNSERLLLYDPSTRKVREVGPTRSAYVCRAFIYYESLVSVVSNCKSTVCCC